MDGLRRGGKYFGDFRTAVVEGVVAESNETAWKHYFAAQDGDGFHAVAEKH